MHAVLAGATLGLGAAITALGFLYVRTVVAVWRRGDAAYLRRL